ncbi:MAG TPA: DUF1893 domain-containing protein [Clostridia bacterium]|jgi:hypothetical protein|nr:DUF1893 domain-containing protein [Clostridia bacterium]
MNEDLQKAIKILKEKKYKIAVVKDGELIYGKDGRGISPLLELYENKDLDLTNSSAADKVVGNAAALLYKDLGVAQVYGELASFSALEVLKKAGIFTETEKKVPYILAPDKQNICPMEQLARKSINGEDFARRARQFLTELLKQV